MQLQTETDSPAADFTASGRYGRAISEGARDSADMGTQAQLDEAEAEAFDACAARLSFSLCGSRRSGASHTSSSTDELGASKSSVRLLLRTYSY